MRKIKMNSLRTSIIALTLMISCLAGHSQGTLASGTVSGSSIGGGLWQYTITLTDTGANPISSLWYSWTPDTAPFFYLPDSSASEISGQDSWTGAVDGDSIRFSGGTALTTGQSVELFYEADFSPTMLADAAHSGLSVAYDGPIEGGPGTPDFAITAAPEPGSVALMGSAALILVLARRFKMVLKHA
ncbi:MAG TPA: PEP-CTERM sorting domain-containing protein [Verrucomicrobiae bacterium]|jgi:hypothetical protein